MVFYKFHYFQSDGRDVLCFQICPVFNDESSCINRRSEKMIANPLEEIRVCSGHFLEHCFGNFKQKHMDWLQNVYGSLTQLSCGHSEYEPTCWSAGKFCFLVFYLLAVSSVSLPYYHLALCSVQWLATHKTSFFEFWRAAEGWVEIEAGTIWIHSN